MGPLRLRFCACLSAVKIFICGVTFEEDTVGLKDLLEESLFDLLPVYSFVYPELGAGDFKISFDDLSLCDFWTEVVGSV